MNTAAVDRIVPFPATTKTEQRRRRILGYVLFSSLLCTSCGPSEIQLIVNVSDYATKRPLPQAGVIVGKSSSVSKASTDTDGNAYLWVLAGEDVTVTVGANDELHYVYQAHMTFRRNPEHLTVVLHQGHDLVDGR